MWRLGIDVGGTFTDLYGRNDGSQDLTAEVLTNTDDRARGVMNALDEAGNAACDPCVDGPCIVVFEHACAVRPLTAGGAVDKYGNMLIDIA